MIMPGGVLAFLEVKRPGNVPRILQVKRITQLNRMGFYSTW